MPGENSIELAPAISLQLETDIAEKGFSILDNFLTCDEVNAILERFHEIEKEDGFRQAGIGKQNQFQVATEVRGDIIRWLNPETEPSNVHSLLDKTRALMRFFREHFRLPVRDLEMHYAEYPPGRFYKRHSDCFREKKHRLISFVYYFNENWKPEDGGELRIYHENGHTDVAPVSGRLALFRSELEHEVLTTNAKRYSITGWLLDRPLDLTFL